MTENRGGAYRFRDEIIFCLTGADMKAELDGVIVEPYTPTIASPGAVLSLSEAKQGIRTYLLVAESLDMPLTLGSAATFTLGGYNNEWTIQIDPQKVKAIESTHGPAENMAPFSAYLSTDEANDINGAVFSVTGDA